METKIVAPSNLAITPDAVVEGQEFTVSCKSTGADPQSKHDYSK